MDKLLFLYLYLLLYYQFQYFAFYIFSKFKRANGEIHLGFLKSQNYIS